MYRIVFYVIVTNLSIIAALAAAVNMTNNSSNNNEPISSRMIPNYNIPSMMNYPVASAAPPAIKFPLTNPYSMRFMPGKPGIDPLLFAPALVHGIVPMALSFSVGYFLLRLLTLGLFFVEKELAFPYGHYRIDNKMIGMDPTNVWDRSDSLGTKANILEQKFHKSMDKYNMNIPGNKHK